MTSVQGITTLAIIAVISLYVGLIIYKRKVKTSDDFLVAGRSLGTALAAASLIATWSNSYTIFVNSQFAYTLSFPNYILLLIISLSLPILIAIPIGVRALNVFRQGYSLPDMLSDRVYRSSPRRNASIHRDSVHTHR